MLVLGVSKSARKIRIVDDWGKEPILSITFKGFSVDNEAILNISNREQVIEILMLTKGVAVNVIENRQATIMYGGQHDGCCSLAFDFDPKLKIYRQKIYMNLKRKYDGENQDKIRR